MKKQPLNEEFRRMQKLAGLINENQMSGEYSAQKNRVKEWLELAFEGETVDPEINKKVEILLNNNNQMTEELFRKIWSIYTKKYSTGDVGADWDAFDVTFMWVMDGDESHFDNY